MTNKNNFVVFNCLEKICFTKASCNRIGAVQSQLHALGIVFEENGTISWLKTTDEVELSGVTVTSFVEDADVADNIERLRGEDATEIAVCFDIAYSESGSVNRIIVRRGNTNKSLGKLRELQVSC